MKIYWAAPLFSDAEREWNESVIKRIEAMGHKVFLPQRDTPQNSSEYEIFSSDKAAIDWADTVIGVMDGADPDSGTCWEMGYAYGLSKITIALRTDFRKSFESSDIDTKGFNLMISRSVKLVFYDVEDLLGYLILISKGKA